MAWSSGISTRWIGHICAARTREKDLVGSISLRSCADIARMMSDLVEGYECSLDDLRGQKYSTYTERRRAVFVH